MKDMNDIAKLDLIEPMIKNRGRPRKYANAADKQKAYRENNKTNTVNYKTITDATKRAIAGHMRDEQKEENGALKILIKGYATGAFMLWCRIVCDMNDKDFAHDEEYMKTVIAGNEH